MKLTEVTSLQNKSRQVSKLIYLWLCTIGSPYRSRNL